MSDRRIELNAITKRFGEHTALAALDLHVRRGESVAIVGHTGAGKTTTISLLMRFYDIQQGEILLDGHNIALLDLDYLRRAFAVVLRTFFFFLELSNRIFGWAQIFRENVSWLRRAM